MITVPSMSIPADSTVSAITIETDGGLSRLMIEVIPARLSQRRDLPFEPLFNRLGTSKTEKGEICRGFRVIK